MSEARLRRGWPAALLAVGALLIATPSATAASDPLFVFTPTYKAVGIPPPPPVPLPTGFVADPCGMGVDSLGHFYVSDYYHNVVDVYDQNANYTSKEVTGATGYLSQYTAIDALDGPCGLALDNSGNLYVNDYHRAVIRYPGGIRITGATTPEETHPTGVAVDPSTGNVYVDQRTHVSVFGESGEAVMTGPPGSEEPLQIGQGSLQDGYGVAFSQFPATAGRLYVPDAAADTVKVYDSSAPEAGPVEEIDGSQTPTGGFVSLRDASVAVDRVTGEIYVLDNLQPEYTEEPQAIVYVFNPDGTYEGHLKFLVTWGMPAGLAVDNSETATQGRVYVTSGNSIFGSIYAYGPGAATTAPINLPGPDSSPLAEPSAPQGGPAGSGCGSCGEGAVGPALSQEGPIPVLQHASLAAPSAATKRRHRRGHRHGAHRKAHSAHPGGVKRDR